MKAKIITFLRKYWREIILIIFLLNMQAGINKAINNSENAYIYASKAATNASEAIDYAYDASNYASEASDYASQAADSASYCEYLD
jgi:hypothetical protein